MTVIRKTLPQVRKKKYDKLVEGKEPLKELQNCKAKQELRKTLQSLVGFVESPEGLLLITSIF